LYSRLYQLDSLLEECEQVQASATEGRSFTAKTTVPGWLYEKVVAALSSHGITTIRRVDLSAIGAQPTVRVLPLSPEKTTVLVIDALFTLQAQVLLELRGPWEDDSDDSEESQTAP
jgi:hypothetical protein